LEADISRADVDCIHLRFCFRDLYPLFTAVEISPGLHIYFYALDLIEK
jgi:hypothetical protein